MSRYREINGIAVVHAAQFVLDEHGGWSPPKLFATEASSTGYMLALDEVTAIEIAPLDWIITDRIGAVSVCKADVFAKTYEPVVDRKDVEASPAPPEPMTAERAESELSVRCVGVQWTNGARAFVGEVIEAPREAVRERTAALAAVPEVERLREENDRLRCESGQMERHVRESHHEMIALKKENARLMGGIHDIVDANTLRERSGWSCAVCHHHLSLAKLHWPSCPVVALRDLLKGNQQAAPGAEEVTAAPSEESRRG